MMQRLDKELVYRKLVLSRSQAESYIKLGAVHVNGKEVTKAGMLVSEADKISIKSEQYVSRAALKLASIANVFQLDFRGTTVLDIGSSTGGFTDYALQHGARKVVAVDVGTDQLHPILRADSRVELYEKTDIRDFKTDERFNLIVADVSFISLTQILPAAKRLSQKQTVFIMMCKPQFEAGKDQVNKGVIKNSAIRRQILRDFEAWLSKNGFVILDKADSQVAGTKGNVERFYKLRVAT
ncbi:MAG TPA: TlyA family RNA methyltransferase [Candidatus Saccharibacteria bacterium]|nr:TlyA family RNA methyltransferase [Candidatus Saccharibacteria bacterium]